MQKCRPPSFLHTNTTVLHHGLWLGWIAPTSNISFTCAWTLSTIGGGILWNLSLKILSLITLISCFAKSVQPNSLGSREKILWYSTNRAWAAAWFPSDHSSRPDKSSCWKNTSLLCSTEILVHWILCISSNFFRVLQGPLPTGGTPFTATTWVTLMPLAIVIGMAVRFFTTTATRLLLEITSMYVFTTLKPWDKWGPSPPFRDCIITCMLLPRSRVFIQPCIILDEKVSTSSFFVVLTTSFQLVESTAWFVTVPLWIESPTHQHGNNLAILNPLKETDNKSISLSLITLMIQLMVGVPRVTSTWDPKTVESDTTRATWPLL